MKRIVFLLGSYYPNYSAVGKCQGNLADEFAKRGYEVVVIAKKTRLNEQSEEQYNNQKIIRIAAKDFDVEQKHIIRAQRGKRISSLYMNFFKVKRALRVIIGRNSIDSLNSGLYLKALNNLTDTPDVIIPSCGPFDAVFAALHYNKIKNVSIIPVLYDMFAESDSLHRIKINKILKASSNRKLEKEMFENSKAVFYMPSWSKYIKSNYRAYEHKTVEIEHPLVHDNGRANNNKKTREKSISLVYAGSLIKGYVEPDALLSLVRNSKLELSLEFFSAGSACETIEKASQKNIVNNGWISYESLIKKMMNSDILISIGEVTGRQVSSKIFEYISLGKPILHLYYTDDDVNIKYLDRYPLSLCVKCSNVGDNTTIKDFDAWCLENASKQLNYGEIYKLFYNMTPAYVVDLIEKRL